jgi:uncharacterized protein YjdB
MSLLRSLCCAAVCFTLLPGCDDGGLTGPLRPEDVARVTLIGNLPRGIQLSPGATFRVTAEVYDQAGHKGPGYPVEWTSSNPAIASVDSLGVVTGRLPGQVMVTAIARSTTVSGSIETIVTSVSSNARAY